MRTKQGMLRHFVRISAFARPVYPNDHLQKYVNISDSEGGSKQLSAIEKTRSPLPCEERLLVLNAMSNVRETLHMKAR